MSLSYLTSVHFYCSPLHLIFLFPFPVILLSAKKEVNYRENGVALVLSYFLDVFSLQKVCSWFHFVSVFFFSAKKLPQNISARAITVFFVCFL